MGEGCLYHPGKASLPAILLACSLFIAALVPRSALAGDLDDQRRAYADAVRAMERGDWSQYRQWRSGLNDYPLAIYLDYFELARRQDAIAPAEALAFLERSADSPLANRFLGRYLEQAGAAQRWHDLLRVKPDEPNSIALKCYFFRAHLAQGDRNIAWQGAQRLWPAGHSQPAACDPLFNAWEADGKLTDALVWTRLLNAFDARQQGLLAFVARKGSEQLRPWADILQSLQARPEDIRTLALPGDNPLAADIATRGLALLAESNPQSALDGWRDLQGQVRFTAEQARQVESAIALQSLLDRTQAHRAWLDEALPRWRDDKLTGIRLRWALRELDWAGVLRTLPSLSDAAREESVWRYWHAIAQERHGDGAAARAGLEALAGERDYYGFLAADKLGRPYAFLHQRLVLSDAASLERSPAFRRVEELIFQAQPRLAQSEWHALLQGTTDRSQQQDLALLATRNGWYRMAIDAATRAEAWNALEQRFPMPYQAAFQRHADLRRVPDTQLMAIARRESAFYPEAESPVGARGLMQVMPQTAEAVAASLRLPHRPGDLFDVEHNIALGSAYYRQLLDRFGDNRVYALAAYNAGPHRVDRWRHPVGQGVPVDAWIESIPFFETRNYVQAVLAYNVVFQYLTGESEHLLTAQERRAAY